MRSFRSVMQWRQGVRAGAGLLFSSFLVTSGCSDEVGGDGWEPPPPTNTAGSNAVTGGMGGDDGSNTTGGKGGSGGMAGKGGKGAKGGSAGTGIVFEDGGMGGQPPASGAVCGNMVVEEGEECDDGNTKSFDGCSADCKKNCEICERQFCAAVRSRNAGDYNWSSDAGKTPQDPVMNLLGLLGMPAGGPLSDVPSVDVARDMIDCIRREQCAQLIPEDTVGFNPTTMTDAQGFDAKDKMFFRCFCDRNIVESSYLNSCKTPKPEDPQDIDPTKGYFEEGKCVREIWGASGKQMVGEVLAGFYSAGIPMGAANYLLQGCDVKLCTEECLPELSVGTVAEISADIVAASNEAGESPIGDLMADAQRSSLSTDIALVNSSTFISDYGAHAFFYKAAQGRPADADGRLLESEIRQVLWGMEPTAAGTNKEGGSYLETLQLTGSQLYQLLNLHVGELQVSGVTFTWDNSAPTGSKVTEIKKGATPIDKNATYSVACNERLAAQINGELVGVGAPVNSRKSPEAELVKYLKAQPQPIAPPSLDRIVRLN